MGTPFLGEIKIISWNFAPQGWAFCNGQLLPINQNQPLFSLFGTMYGGDGRVNFALPNLRGRVPIHIGASYTQGQAGGEQAHTLNLSEMPAHNHIANATSDPHVANPENYQPLPNDALFAVVNSLYSGTASNLTTLLPATCTNVGGSQPHQNMQPYLTLNFIVALQGIFPSRN
jgi:microcystin-dependent protein